MFPLIHSDETTPQDDWIYNSEFQKNQLILFNLQSILFKQLKMLYKINFYQVMAIIF